MDTSIPASKIFACKQSKRLAESIASKYGVPLGNVITSAYSDGEFQPSFEESIRGARIFIVGSTHPNSDNLMEMLLMSNISIKLSLLGCVEPTIKIRAPRIDSSNEGWNSPSL